MTKGNLGTWWVLKQADCPLYWTGEIVRTLIDAKPIDIPMFAMDRAEAAQFEDEAAAAEVHSFYGLAPNMVPHPLEFRA